MKQLLSYKQGFTLIELLVVITIIGLLASTVLASMASARLLAKDSAVIQQLNALANQIEIYRSVNGTYGVTANDDDTNACRGNQVGVLDDTVFKDPEVRVITSKIMTVLNNSFRPYCSVRANDSGSWAFSAPLFNQTGATGSDERGWCVDSQGAKKEVFFDMNNIGAPLNVVSSIAKCP